MWSGLSSGHLASLQGCDEIGLVRFILRGKQDKHSKTSSIISFLSRGLAKETLALHFLLHTAPHHSSLVQVVDIDRIAAQTQARLLTDRFAFLKGAHLLSFVPKSEHITSLNETITESHKGFWTRLKSKCAVQL